MLADQDPAGRVLHVPPGFDRDRLLLTLNSAALEHSPEYRRAITRTSPLLFGLTYLLHHLHGPETGGEVSLSELHVALARAARRWVRQDLGPSEVRDAWIGPRGAAKSTWTLLVLPLWATAHGHRRFVAMFSDAGPQARQHLATLRRELADNELLRLDFPELCAPARMRGRSDQDTQVNHVTLSGVAFMAKGMGSAVLGAKHGSTRPDLIIGDDVEPIGSRYTAEAVKARLGALVNGVLDMNPNAAVQLAGTVVRRGSIMHDLVRHAVGDPGAPRWVVDERFRVHYFPAIVVDDDGRERSLWPQRWSLEFLRSIRHTRRYALNFANLPPDADAGWWSHADVVVDAGARAVRRGLWIDPAGKSRVTSDFTALAVVGVEAGPRGRAVVEWVTQRRLPPAGLRVLAGQVLDRNPAVREVHVDVTNGGDAWLDVLGPVAAARQGVTVTPITFSESKADRFTRLLDYYQRGMVVHGRELPALTDQQLAYPDVAHDDVLDAVAAGVEHWMRERVDAGRG